MTNLSDKFGHIEGIITTKFDAVISKLSDIHTAITAANGNIEAAPIVAAIEALRGVGPENTIRSLNQSIWNIAGPAPGKSITDLHTLLTAQHAALGVYLAAIGADTDATANALGIPTGDATSTLLGVMYSLQFALTHYGAGDPNLLSVIYAINEGIGGVPYDSLALTTVRGLIAQQTEATGRLLDPISYPPVDVCENAYMSNGYVYYQMNFEIFPGIPLSTPSTIATWPVPPLGYSISRETDAVTNFVRLNSNDWLDWRIYVASSASTFGIHTSTLSPARLPTNQWVSFSPEFMYYDTLSFLVDGSSALKVYICASSQLVGGVAPAGADFTSSTGTSVVNGRRYVVWPDLEGLTESAGGIELTPASSWAGYEVYIQTSAPNATLHDITDPAQSIAALPVNQWITLAGNHTLSVSVDAGYLVKGYMRFANPLEFDLLATDVYYPYNYGTGPWPESSMWTIKNPIVYPWDGITVLQTVRMKLTPFNNQGASVIQTITSPGGTVTYPINMPIYVEIPTNYHFAITGGTGKVSFHVVINPPDWP